MEIPLRQGGCILLHGAEGSRGIAKRLGRGAFHFLDAAYSVQEGFEIQAGELVVILEVLALAGAKKRWREPR